MADTPIDPRLTERRYRKYQCLRRRPDGQIVLAYECYFCPEGEGEAVTLARGTFGPGLPGLSRLR